MKKRVLAIVLSLAIAVAFMPTLAFAEEPEPAGGGEGGGQANTEVITAPQNINQMILKYLEGINLKALRDNIKALNEAGKAVRDAFNKTDLSDDEYNEQLLTAIKEYGQSLDTLIDQVDIIGEAVESFQTNMQDMIDEMQKSVKERIEKLQKNIKNAGLVGREVLKRQLEKAQELNTALNRLNSALKEKTDELIGKINGQLKTAVDGFHTSLVKKINDMAETVENFNLDAEIKKVQDQVDAFQDQLESKMGEMMAAVGALNKALQDQVSKATGAVKDFYEAQQAKVKDLYEALKRLNTALNEKVAELDKAIEEAVENSPLYKSLAKAREDAEAAVDALKTNLAALNNQIKEAIKGAPDKIYDDLLARINAMTEAVNEMDPAKAIEKVTDQLKQFQADLKANIAKIKEGLANFQEYLQNKIAEAQGKAKEAYEAQMEKVKALRKALADLNEAIQDKIEEALGESQLYEALVEAREKAKAAIGELKTKLDALNEQIKEAIKDAPDNIYDRVLYDINKMTEAVKNLDPEKIAADVNAQLEQFQEEMKANIAKMKEDLANFQKYLQEKIAEAQGKAKEAYEAQMAKVEALRDALVELNEAIQDKIAAIEEAMEEAGVPEKIEALKAQMAKYQKELMEKAAAMQEAFKEAAKEKFDEQVAKAVEFAKIAHEQLEILIEKYKAGEINKEMFKEMFIELHNKIISTAAALKDLAMETPLGAFIVAAENFHDAIEAGLVKMTDRLKGIVDQIKAMVAMIEEAIQAKISGAVAKVVEEAKAAIEASLDVVLPYVAGQLFALKDKLEAGDFDKLLEPLGINGKQLVDIIENLIDALLSDKSVMEMQEEIEMLSAAQQQLSDKLDATTSENAALKDEVKKNADEKAAFQKDWNNAKKVEAKKVVAKKAKYSKKKVTVTWNKFKAGKINGYELSWKVGKKAWKTKNVKGANKTKAKTGKIKAKKKTKIKVRVRSYFTMKYAGKTQKFFSKWSKVKKVKVK